MKNPCLLMQEGKSLVQLFYGCVFKSFNFPDDKRQKRAQLVPSNRLNDPSNCKMKLLIHFKPQLKILKRRFLETMSHLHHFGPATPTTDQFGVLIPPKMGKWGRKVNWRDRGSLPAPRFGRNVKTRRAYPLHKFNETKRLLQRRKIKPESGHHDCP